MLKAVQAVQRLQNKPSKPEQPSYFNEDNVWHYISISDTRRCEYCELYDGGDYFGDELQRLFPDLEIRSQNVIDVNLHLTLWGKETCRCKLVRTFM